MAARHTEISVAKKRAKFNGYIVLDRRGGMRMSRTQPRLGPGELSCAVSIEVPLALFERPALSATVVIPDDAQPETHTAEVVQQLKNALRVVPGVELKIGT